MAIIKILIVIIRYFNIKNMFYLNNGGSGGK